jgi:alkanesulfonate monooxygenase SsuD/methylene tetrahydromethanopterin reductase-like flavin-dependent oxidoreductase (luciferase family)
VQIGIGIPNTVLGTQGSTIVEWAKRAEARGFSTLATIGRVAWAGYDELVALAAAAGATERIGLLTNVLLAPAWPAALLAKETASLDQLSGGRFTLGVGVGSRPDDFAAADVDFSSRGRRFDELLEVLHASWRGEPIDGFDRPFGPTALHGRVPLLFGGDPARAARRVVRWGADGFTIGGAPPDVAAQAAETFRNAFADEGGVGTPRVVCLTYFSLGDEHRDESVAYLRAYYASIGEYAEMIAQGAARDEDDIRSRIETYEAGGVDELILDPSVPHVDQVDRLGDVVFG